MHIVMTLNVLLSVMSLAHFVYSVCKYFEIGFNQILGLILLITIGIFGFYSWPEVYTWYSGTTNYSFPLSFSLFGIGLMIKERKKDVFTSVVSSIFLFVASGGTLEVAGMGCFILLLFVIIKKLQGKLRPSDCIIFFVALVGSLINAVAPGNFVRHEVIDSSGVHLFAAIQNSIIVVFEWINKILLESPFILLLLIPIWIGIKYAKQLKENNYIIYIYIHSL